MGGVHFLMLDTESPLGPDSLQGQFVATDLAKVCQLQYQLCCGVGLLCLHCAILVCCVLHSLGRTVAIQHALRLAHSQGAGR